MFRTIVLVALATTASCQNTQRYQNSSVVEFLYPDANQETVSTQIPQLTLPLRVGIAFTPTTAYADTALSEKSKLGLLDRVSERFRGYDFVSDIEIIPSAYLRPGGSFTNLEQLKRMFNVDVITLVSYDQSAFTDEGLASLAYWTLVGAYIVPAEKNTTHTMLDAVVYDVDSRRMLFRAPGVSSIRSNSTIVALEARMREDAAEGFEAASIDLATNLDLQLAAFRVRVKESPQEVVIARRSQSGGGASSLLMLLAALSLVFVALKKPVA